MALNEEEKQRLIDQEKFRKTIVDELNGSNNKKNSFEKIEKFTTLTKNIILSVIVIILGILLIPRITPMLNEFLSNSKIEEVKLAGLKFVTQKPINEIFQNDSLDTRNSIMISGIDGFESEIGKGSQEFLEELKSQLDTKFPNGIDIMTIVNSKSYNPHLLNDYIRTLGIKFIVFKKEDENDNPIFDGWIEASIFSGQLIAFYGRHTLNYEKMRELAGIKNVFVYSNQSAKETLEVMKKNHLENIAVKSPNEKFLYILNRGDLLSEVVNTALLQ